jgi:hypothetical protein
MQGLEFDRYGGEVCDGGDGYMISSSGSQSTVVVSYAVPQRSKLSIECVATTHFMLDAGISQADDW